MDYTLRRENNRCHSQQCADLEGMVMYSATTTGKHSCSCGSPPCRLKDLTGEMAALDIAYISDNKEHYDPPPNPIYICNTRLLTWEQHDEQDSLYSVTVLGATYI